MGQGAVNEKIYAPLAIDMRSVQTGIFTIAYTEKFLEDGVQPNSATFMYDESFKISQASRRIKKRSKEKAFWREIAKRVYPLIVMEHCNADISMLPDKILGIKQILSMDQLLVIRKKVSC